MTGPSDFLFSTPRMAAIFSSEAHVRAMLTFEAALAQAEARAGIIPQEAAEAIGASCRESFIDIEILYRKAALAGTPAIPMVHMLTEQVSGDAQKYVHWGATSQDVIDTALMLQMRDGLALLIADLLGVCAACATLAEVHRRTLMAGRTLLQQALPITFGLKAAHWLALATRQVQALRERLNGSLAVQLGGAAGTLAALGDKGIRVVELLAAELKLPAPDLPWHTERDRVAEIAASLGVIAGAMEKIARDVILLAQTEVGEATEGDAPGKGGSSAMPQKHNPVEATGAIAAAHLAIGMVPMMLSAMGQEHERGAGGWQTEWAALPDLFRFTSGAIAGVQGALSGLQIDSARMKANLDRTNGLIMAESLTMALASHLGRPEAQRIVKMLCEEAVKAGINLLKAALADAQVRAILSPVEIEQALDPGAYLGSADIFIDRALAAYRAL